MRLATQVPKMKINAPVRLKTDYRGILKWMEGTIMQDIVELLKNEGYGVVEGADAVRAKIDELYAESVINSFIPKNSDELVKYEKIIL